MRAGLLGRVRTSCREVVARAGQVAIDDPRLRVYSRNLTPEALELPVLDPRCHYLGQGAGTVTFMLTLEAVNFGSGYFPELRPYAGLRGYFAVAAALRDWFVDSGVPTPQRLQELSREDCARLFGQSATGLSGDLMALFAGALAELGKQVESRYQGRFEGLVEAAEGSAEQLVERLVAMPGFADVAKYEELEVPLLKRAQLTAADLSLAFGGQGIGAFRDLDRLTTFADDLVPHVLATDGLLRYSPELAERISRGEPLPSGSPEEVEIRAATIEAVERIAAELAACGRPVSAMRVDYLLWNRGLEPRYRAAPRHRTLSRFY